jgi:two-component system, NarL family, sensor histidine kinase BarA
VSSRIYMFYSLRFRMSLLVASVIFAVVMITAALNAWRGFGREIDNYRALLAGAGSAYVAALADPVDVHNQSAALASLRGVRDLPNVLQTDIKLADGSPFVQIGSGAILLRESGDPAAMTRSQIWSARYLRFELPIVKGGETVGTLGLLSDVSEMKQAVRQQLLITAMTALFAILIGIAIAQVMIARMTRPLSVLTRVMGSFAGDGAAALPDLPVGKDETGVLASAFNDMIASIRERDQRLALHLETLEETVENRTLDLRLARDEAEAANAAKSAFLATVSHEIRTPMNGMLVMAEMLSAADLSHRHRRYADIILRSGTGLLTIINDILDLSKIEAGHLDLESIPLSPEALAIDAASLFWEKAREGRLELAAQVSPRVPGLLLGDPTRLNQIITNLVNNALKFTQSGGVLIRLDALPCDQADTVTLVIEVEDTGIGIPADRIDHIFESFSQADQTTTRRFGGTGLGLSVCQKLVTAMGGNLSVTSEVGRGSVFRVDVAMPVETMPAGEIMAPLRVILDLPQGVEKRALGQALSDFGCIITDDSPDFIVGKSSTIARSQKASPAPRIVLTDIGDTLADEVLRDGRAADCLTNPYSRADLSALLRRIATGTLRGIDALYSVPGTAKVRSFAGCRVLAADDNAVNREVLREALSTLKIEAVFVEDGAEAVRRAAEEHFDLVFMDGSMPVMDGLEATRQIRAAEARLGKPRLPVIALTAQMAGQDTDTWTGAGADGRVTKPFSLDHLTAAIAIAYCGPMQENSAVPQVQPDETPLLNETTIATLDALGQKSGRDVRAKVWNMFIERSPIERDALSEMMESGTLATISRKAHAFSSMALSAGAGRLADLLASVDSLAASEAERKDIAQMASKAAVTLEETLAAMRAAAPASNRMAS